ncbi:kinesin-like protein Klp61F [Drosophila miranda]|uniref:kinesin-like protein Klp61F n=1 Tax=Drosophila miranda TaxID=7229 RepID=UPI00143F2375|nr:kinesin-like protein Klp61F [Drosophila miranda]
MEVEFTMRISYLELYNEELCDLLSTDDSPKKRIFDDSTKKGSVIIQGLEEITVQSKDDFYKLLEKGKLKARGMMPTSESYKRAKSQRQKTEDFNSAVSFPTIVCVLPVPVCPYANTVQL